jgi:hypothetical protein
MDKDTSLNYNQFLKEKKEVCEVLQSIKTLSSAKRKMEALSKKFNYIRLFSKQGVQGLAGHLEIKKNKLPVVFKVSVELDKSIEHENSVLEALSTIKSFCPNFIGVYNMIELPISRTYILDNKDEDDDYYSSSSESDSEESEEASSADDEKQISQKKEESEEESDEEKEFNLLSFDEEYSLNNVLFLEYISNISLKHVIRYSDKQVLYSQILCILCSLYMAQKHLSFTHYDLHIDNVMLKPIDENAMFVYNLGTDAFLIPTFGLYPVIIDMGSSYCKHLEDQSMKSSPNHYDKGLQPTFYDTFNDLHHFLLSLFYEIERESEEYYFLSTRLMWLFKSIPLLRKKGWKILPVDVLKSTRNIIREVSPELYKLSSYHDFDKDFLEVLSFGIRLPWKNELDKDIIKCHEIEKSEDSIINFSIKKYFVKFFTEFQKFDEIEGFEDPHDLLYILKEIVDLVYLHSDNINENTHKAIIKRMINDFKTRVGFCLFDIPESIDFLVLFYNCKMSISVLKCMFYDGVKPNIEKINDCYSNMEIKSAIDIIKFIKKNTSVRYNYSRHTSLHIWDGVSKTSKKIMLNSLMTNIEVEKLNKDHPTLSEYKILKLLKFKK